MTTANPYPNLDNFKPELIYVQFFTKQQDIKDKRNCLQQEYNKYSKLYKRCKKFNNVDYLTASLMTVGTGLSTSSIVTTASGIGIPVSFPLGIVGLGATSVSAIVGVLGNFVKKKEKKYAIFKEKSYTILKEFNRMLHIALNDQKIDQNEYDNLMSKYDEYIQFKNSTNKEHKNESKNLM